MKELVGKEVITEIEKLVPGSTIEADDYAVLVQSNTLDSVMRALKETPEFDFNYLDSLTAVDYLQYFEVVYHLISMTKKQSIVVKTRCPRENPEVPSVTPLWQGADLQEREVYDLMGVQFSGHPFLRRILLWEGFEGHPLRKDYL